MLKCCFDHCLYTVCPYCKQLAMHWWKSSVAPLLVRMVTASAVRLSACVLTAPLAQALPLERLVLGGKRGNTVTKSRTEGSVLITVCVCPTSIRYILSSPPCALHPYATSFLHHCRVCEWAVGFMHGSPFFTTLEGRLTSVLQDKKVFSPS